MTGDEGADRNLSSVAQVAPNFKGQPAFCRLEGT